MISFNIAKLENKFSPTKGDDEGSAKKKKINNNNNKKTIWLINKISLEFFNGLVSLQSTLGADFLEVFFLLSGTGSK